MTIYEVVKKFDCRESDVLNMRHASITFSYEDVHRSTIGDKKTVIGSFPTFRIDDCVKFSLHKETDEWYHFKDCNNLDYQLSIKKAAK